MSNGALGYVPGGGHSTQTACLANLVAHPHSLQHKFLHNISGGSYNTGTGHGGVYMYGNYVYGCSSTGCGGVCVLYMVTGVLGRGDTRGRL